MIGSNNNKQKRWYASVCNFTKRQKWNACIAVIDILACVFCIILPAMFVLRGRLNAPSSTSSSSSDSKWGFLSTVTGRYRNNNKPWMSSHPIYRKLEQEERIVVDNSDNDRAVSIPLRDELSAQFVESHCGLYSSNQLIPHSMCLSAAVTSPEGTLDLMDLVDEMAFVDPADVTAAVLSQKGIVVVNMHQYLFKRALLTDIYKYYDEIIVELRKLRSQNPTSILIWIVDRVPSDIHIDLLRLHQFLMSRYVIQQFGVLVHVVDYSYEQLTTCKYHKLGPAIETFIARSLLHDTSNSAESNCLSSLFLSAVCLQLSRLSANNAISIKKAANKLSFVWKNDIDNKNQNTIQLYGTCQKVLNSRKYIPICMPKPNVLLPILVTCLGGCGSHFISQSAISRLNVDLPHESLGLHGSVSWLYAVNDVYAGVQYPHHAFLPYRSLFNPRFERVIHIVRSPMQHISSFTAHTHLSYEFVRNFLPKKQFARETATATISNPFQSKLIEDKHSIDKCQSAIDDNDCHLRFSAQSWILWNQLIDNFADARYHIEEIDNILKDVCEHLPNTTVFTSSSCKSAFPDAMSIQQKQQLRASSYTQQQHQHYTIHDLHRIDDTGRLAATIVKLGRKFGYNDL